MSKVDDSRVNRLSQILLSWGKQGKQILDDDISLAKEYMEMEDIIADQTKIPAVRQSAYNRIRWLNEIGPQHRDMTVLSLPSSKSK